VRHHFDQPNHCQRAGIDNRANPRRLKLPGQAEIAFVVPEPADGDTTLSLKATVADAAEDHQAGRTIAARASAAHLRPFPVSFSPSSRTSIDLGFHCSSCSSSSSPFVSSADSPNLAIDYLVPHQCLARYFGLALKSVDITWSQ
jgi:hypothetical protein